jgi:hypothetical protein
MAKSLFAGNETAAEIDPPREFAIEAKGLLTPAAARVPNPASTSRRLIIIRFPSTSRPIP